MAKLILLACSVLLVLNGAFVQGADPCVLDGFNLTGLHSALYWNVSLAKEKCIVPRGYSRRDIANCTVHFSICESLPQEICVNQTNSSTCEVVTTSDRKTHYFNIGNFQGNKEFQPTGGDNDVGFATIRQGSANDSTLCNSTFATVLSWKCEPTTNWDRTKNNVTLFAESSIDFEACLLDLSFNYSGACYQPPTLIGCQLDRFDLAGLKSLDYWFVTLSSNETCLIPNANPCVIYFSFCQGLPLSTGDGCYEAAVCQAGNTAEGNVSYSMGLLNEHNQFIEDLNDFPTGGFYIDVVGGDKICTGTDTMASTSIVLVCDPNANWRNRDLSGIAAVTQLDCEYTITIPFAGACLLPASSTAHTATPTPTPTTSTSSHHPTSTSATSTKSHSVNSTTTASHTTKVSPSPTSTSHRNTKTTSGAHTTSTRHGPVHSPTTGPPSHHTTPEGHHTSPEKKTTTQPTAKPNSHKIAGLTAGLVIFVLISVALLVLFIIAAFYIYKRRRQGGEYERLKPSNDM